MNKIRIPTLTPTLIAIRLIKPFKGNSKKHPREQLDIIKKSIEEFGFRNPILLNNFQNKEIICGHGRFQAAKELGMKEIPCLSAEDLNHNQIRAFRVMDNKAAESEWDYELLKEDFQALEDDGYDLDLTGFNQEEMDCYLKLSKIEEINLGEDRYNVIEVLPPEAPRLKERFLLVFENIEDYIKFKNFLIVDGKLDTTKLLRLIK